jgi:TetR/AcrR family transcriptional repressor of nem operon
MLLENCMMVIMRYPPEHKQTIRSRIITAAGKALRTGGVHGVGIPALMRKVGLTHGGFYSHFANRDQLVAESVLEAARKSGQMVFEQSASWKEACDRYLSVDHVAHPEGGCVLAALGSEGARQPKKVRASFDTIARGFILMVGKKQSVKPAGGEVSDRALAASASLVGAIVLARLIEDEALRTRLLATVSRSLE